MHDCDWQFEKLRQLVVFGKREVVVEFVFHIALAAVFLVCVGGYE